jgi:hypothetical protein
MLDEPRLGELECTKRVARWVAVTTGRAATTRRALPERAANRAASMMKDRKGWVWRQSDQLSPLALISRSRHNRVYWYTNDFMATTSSIHIFDSLPYYDNDLEQFPILKEKVERELAKESEPPSTLHPSLGVEIEIFAVRMILRITLSLF